MHLNLPLRPPLVGPVTAMIGDSEPSSRRPTSGAARTGRGTARCVPRGDLDLADDPIRQSILQQARLLGWPVIAEASSGLLGQPGVVPGGTAALADEVLRERLAADLVITVGPFGLDRSVMRWLRLARRHVAVRLRPRTDPPDPGTAPSRWWTACPWSSGSSRIRRGCRSGQGWSARIRAGGGSRKWRPRWQTLTPDDLLVVASSSAIRALAAVARGPGPRVLANRGANGIDGLVSTAWALPLLTVAVLSRYWVIWRSCTTPTDYWCPSRNLART